MDAVPSFIICLVSIILMTARLRIPPFITLISISFLYGILVGLDPERIVDTVTSGAARIFMILGIVIFSGVVIARLLKESGHIDRIVHDIRSRFDRPTTTAGVAGYLLSIPLMCCITTFVVIAPIVAMFREGEGRRTALFTAAVAGVISYVLLYPSPVVYTIWELMEIDMDVWRIDLITIPLSIALLAVVILLAAQRVGGEGAPLRPPTTPSWRAWGPLIVPFVILALGHLFDEGALTDLNVALFAGLLTAMLLAQGDRERAIHDGTKSAGLIIFDLCGAGAFGAVIAASGFADEAFDLLSPLPAIMVPFILASMIQAAQGSRFVTTTVTATILASTSIPSSLETSAMVLMICGGALMFSFVSDPFFWVIRRMTEAEVGEVARRYTLPLSAMGIVVAATGVLLQTVG